MSIESVTPSSHLILWHPLLLLPPIPYSINESPLHMRWPKYWSFSFSISPSNWSPLGWTGWISLQSKGLSRVFSNTIVKSINSLALSFLQVHLSHPYMTTGKTIALTRQIFVGKVMSLFFNMLSRLVITFLPRCKHLLISWLQSPSVVILEPPKIKSATVSTVSHLFIMKWWDWMPWSWFCEHWALSQLLHFPLSLSSRGSLVLNFLPYFNFINCVFYLPTWKYIINFKSKTLVIWLV